MDRLTLHVLVVGGSPDARLAIGQMLDRQIPGAYTITGVDRGACAIVVCRAAPPDCVLLDDRLPDMDALEVLAELRALGDVPIVLLTAEGNEGRAAEALRCGAQACLRSDDVTPEGLDRAIQLAVARGRGGRARGAGGGTPEPDDQRIRLALDMMGLVANAPIGIAFLDTAMRFRYINHGLAAINGRPPEAHLGRMVREISAPLADHLEPIVQRVLATGEPVLEVELSGAPAAMPTRTYTLLSSYYPVRADDGRIFGIGVLVQDFTERRKVDLALREHAETLSRTNAELARALRLKDEFLAMMSHELRTPLSAVLGIGEALGDELYGPLGVRQRQALNTLIRSGRHLLSIISDMLDLARIEAGGEALDLRAVDVDLLCRAALQVVQPAAHEKAVRLLRSVEQGIEGLQADEHRLTQILVNLLDNAVKFTPAGGAVGLEVSADDGQEMIQFSVWDTGIGIDRADFERLFHPFTQLDSGLAREYGGVGLGLTLVRRLVELHGGSITLFSTPGAGSRFSVKLPWSAADNAAPAMSGPRPAPRTWAHHPRVLIADDHEPTLALYTELLTQQGCQVMTARTGAEAVAQVRASRPDVVVLDIQMPELDGLTALRHIRSSPDVATVPVITLTALVMPGDRERCMAAGATAYLAKPVSLRMLLETIMDVLPAPDDDPGE